MSESTQEHRRKAARQNTVSILTVSDTRTLDDDLGGKLIATLLEQSGNVVLERASVRLAKC